MKSKWIYELIIVAILIVVGLCTWWFIATKDERLAEKEVETMIRPEAGVGDCYNRTIVQVGEL
jgi:hypothetical protein